MQMRIFLLTSLLSVCSAAAQVSAPDNLVLDGIPDLDSELAAEIARYQHTRSAGLASWHPVRREMIIGTRFGDTSQLHLVRKPGGARQQLTFRKEPVRGGRFQPETGEHFTYLADNGGDENYQVFAYDLASGKVSRLTDGKSRNGGGRWSPDGRKIAYYSNGRNGRTNDFFIVELEDSKNPRCLFEAPTVGWYLGDWSRDGAKLLLYEYVSVNETRLHVLDIASGKVRQVLPAKGEGRGAFLPAIFGADSNTLIVCNNQNTEFRQPYRVDTNTGNRTPLAPELNWDVEDLALSPDGKLLAFSANENGPGVLHLLDMETGKERSVPKLPSGSVGNLQWHTAGGLLGFNINSARSPSDVFALDLESGEVERWTKSEVGPVNADTFAEPEIVTVKSFDDLPISAIIYRPDAKRFPGPRPVLVSIHGGPEGQSRPRFLGRSNYFLDELGMAIVYPNVRGSRGYGKSFLDLDNGFKREESVRDIAAILDWIDDDANLDGKRVAVIGGSYGGYMSLACMIHYGDRLRCGIDVVGISNFVTFLKNTKDYRRDLRRVEYGDERDEKMQAFLQRISPANQPEKFKKPLLVIQGKNDPRVPVTESEQMVKAIRERGGREVWYLMAKDEGHGFRKKPNRDFEFLVVIEFLKRYLLDSN